MGRVASVGCDSFYMLGVSIFWRARLISGGRAPNSWGKSGVIRVSGYRIGLGVYAKRRPYCLSRSVVIVVYEGGPEDGLQ